LVYFFKDDNERTWLAYRADESSKTVVTMFFLVDSSDIEPFRTNKISIRTMMKKSCPCFLVTSDYKDNIPVEIDVVDFSEIDFRGYVPDENICIQFEQEK
jgi:hypothetical protein